MAHNDQEVMTNVITKAIEDIFGSSDSKNPEQMRILVRRIPVLCVQIEKMSEQMEAMHETTGKLDSYIKDDANWKKEFDVWKTQVVTPLIQKEADSKAVNGFVIKSAKYIAAVVAFIISLIVLYNYIVDPWLRISPK